jgi:hypothetical protein
VGTPPAKLATTDAKAVITSESWTNVAALLVVSVKEPVIVLATADMVIEVVKVSVAKVVVKTVVVAKVVEEEVVVAELVCVVMVVSVT